MLMGFDTELLIFLGSGVIFFALFIFMAALCFEKRMFHDIDRIMEQKPVDYAKARKMYSFPDFKPLEPKVTPGKETEIRE